MTQINRAFTVLIILVLFGGLLWWLRGAYQPLTALPCPTQLTSFISCIKKHTPKPNPHHIGQTPSSPTPSERRALAQAARAVYATALSHNPDCTTALPVAISKRYSVTQLANAEAKFCVLWEEHRGQASNGWGTLIVNRTPKHQLVLGVPHPMFDTGTLAQARDILIQLDALALVIAGAHRNALTDQSECSDYAYRRSDASHHPTGYTDLAAALARTTIAADPWWFLEWHGMRPGTADTTCYDPLARRPIDTYLSAGGGSVSATGFATSLAQAMQDRNPSWNVKSTADRAVCNKAGNGNLLGRYLNDAPIAVNSCAPLTVKNVITKGRFVHIEQLRCIGGQDCRREDDSAIRRASPWIDAISEVHAELSAQTTASSDTNYRLSATHQ